MKTKTLHWVAFSVLAVAQFMVVLDGSITNIALPSIMTELGFTQSALQWVLTAYALSFGGFLLFGGRAADLFGRRRILLIGLGCFTLVSLLIGFSQSPLMLIVLRALQGIAAALMTPAALSIVLVLFEEESERNQALGFWSLISTAGAATGLLLGGLLTQYLSWRWNFFVNVPIGIVITILTVRLVPAHEKESGDTELDLPGAVLVTLGLVGLVYAFSRAPAEGWTSITTLGTIALALALLGGFVWNEARSSHPLMPLSIFRTRNVTAANLIMAPIVAGMFGMFFLSSLLIQGVLHYSPVMTGLSFLPFPIILGVVSSAVPRFVSRYGYKPFIVTGLIFAAVGMGWMARVPLEASYFIDLLPTFVLMPIGLGMLFMPVMAAATAGVPPQEAGLASGLITTSQQMGGAFGLSILTSVAISVTAAAMSPASTEALVQGYRYAFLVGLALMLLALALAVTLIRQRTVSASPVHAST